jgi:pilus assembly protein CpaC
VTPTVLAANRIALKVAPEASDLDYSNAIVLNNVQIPSITTRRADTTVELGDGESFVIGGLVSSNIVSNVSKIPLLGDLPIIGSFFRNFDYKRQDKELVIIVTPRLVQPLARNTELPLPGEREAKPHLPSGVPGCWVRSARTRCPASRADSMMPAIPRPCPTPPPSRCIRKDRR